MNSQPLHPSVTCTLDASRENSECTLSSRSHDKKLLLKKVLQIRKQALEERDNRKEWCTRRLRELREENTTSTMMIASDHQNSTNEPNSFLNKNNPRQIKYYHDTLRNHEHNLRRKCEQLSVSLASLQVSNDSRESSLLQSNSIIHNSMENIKRVFEDCAIQGLENTFAENNRTVTELRFKLALQAFDMYKLDIGEDQKKNVGLNGAVENVKKDTSGYGRISGLALPHAGPIYYALFPSTILNSALRLVASLTFCVSQCLGITLPHPILLRPEMSVVRDEDIMKASYKKNVNSSSWERTKRSDDSKSTTNGTFDDATNLGNFEKTKQHISGKQEKRATDNSNNKFFRRGLSNIKNALIRTQQQQLQQQNSSTKPNKHSTITTTPNDEVLISIDDVYGENDLDPQTMCKTDKAEYTRNLKFPVQSYISHASFAILRENCEDKKDVTEYALSIPDPDKKVVSSSISFSGSTSNERSHTARNTNNNNVERINNVHKVTEEHFSIGLQLLQNDVVALCIRTGVHAKDLWPAEAVLLNLNALWLHCQTKVQDIVKCEGQASIQV